jgi:uncharacterized protein
MIHPACTFGGSLRQAGAREVPITFDCEGSELLGVVHIPSEVRARGVILVVAGGPQYRSGVGRLHVQLARGLMSRGIPVLRFDHRGIGDSEGNFCDFEDMRADLRAAVSAFCSAVPDMREVVLWGGCSAASALMINAWAYPEVTGIIVSNPWVYTPETGDAAVIRHHFSKRMRDKDFWLKVLRLQYNPLPAMALLARNALSRLRPQSRDHAGGNDFDALDDPAQPFIPRMRQGLSRFRGDLLMVMSGRSILSKEFDDLVAADAHWQVALRAPRHLRRHELPEGDQTLSSIASRQELVQVLSAWLLDVDANLYSPVRL